MKEPNFIIAGGVATGTSFLSHSIKDHPQIYLPRIMRPECGFFYKSWEFAKGKDYYLGNWFHEIQNERAIGERSSLNLHGTFNGVAERIYRMFPNMKLIFCLRNPTERAYANYRFTALCGLENLSFEEALDQEDVRIKKTGGWMAEIRPNWYRGRGCYYEQLESFLEFFPKKQILCIKSSELAKDTPATLRRVFRFLEVDENFTPSPQENFTSPNVKSLLVQTFLRKILGKKLDVLTEEYRKGTQKSFAERAVVWNLTTGKKPMKEETRKRLNDFYAPHNEKLAKLLNWDLSDWK